MDNARQDSLRKWLGQRVPGGEMSTPVKASSGLSSDTFLFDLHHQQTSSKLILRAEAQDGGLFPDTDLERQFLIMRALGPTSVPVPAALWFEPDPAVIGSPFIVMKYVEGEVASDFPPGFHGQGHFFDAMPARRRAMWTAAVEQIAALHRLDWNGLGLPDMIGMPRGNEPPLEAHIQQVEGWLEAAEIGPVPVIDQALDVLKRSPAPSSRLSLLWGDARPGNIIYKNDRVAAVVDWELATVGPPELDLFYLIYTSYATAELYGMERMAGLPGIDETVAEYEALIGATIQNRHYYEIFSLLRMQVMFALGFKSSPKGLVYSLDFFNNNSISVRLNKLMSESNSHTLLVKSE